jgi:hypothetical protein
VDESPLPEFLTIEEAARILRIGRNPAYEQANRFIETNGREGLPVVVLGRTRRVPRRKLEELAGGPFETSALSARARKADLQLVADKPPKPTPGAKTAEHPRKRSRRNDSSASHPRLFG